MGRIIYNISLTNPKLKVEAPEGVQVQNLGVNPVVGPRHLRRELALISLLLQTKVLACLPHFKIIIVAETTSMKVVA